jgi:hypothetical protein
MGVHIKALSRLIDLLDNDVLTDAPEKEQQTTEIMELVHKLAANAGPLARAVEAANACMTEVCDETKATNFGRIANCLQEADCDIEVAAGLLEEIED